MAVRREEIIGDARLLLGDCLEVMPTIGEVDICMTDPPYGITSNKWDSDGWLLTFWDKAINCPHVMTASQPFTSKLVLSNLRDFRHEWIWRKNRGSNFANTVREPFKEHESILFFSRKAWTYNPQMEKRSTSGAARVLYSISNKTSSDNYRKFEREERAMRGADRCPSSVQKFNTEVGLHPTQKPIKLFSYLIKTYSNNQETILDPFMGSGTTGVAAVQEGRKFIGVEIEERYFDVACRRIEEAQKQMRLFA